LSELRRQEFRKSAPVDSQLLPRSVARMADEANLWDKNQSRRG